MNVRGEVCLSDGVAIKGLAKLCKGLCGATQQWTS